MIRRWSIVYAGLILAAVSYADVPYQKNCTQREEVFAFTKKPSVKLVGKDKHEISFAVKGFCDVTVGLFDKAGKVVRHLASGVLGKNAPAPFRKDSLEQKIIWDGKDDLGVYVKEPGSLTVKVMLGLKPAFDKRLGGTSPKNLPGYVWGIAIDKDGAYVFTKGNGGFGHISLRKFDHDGRYICSLWPPAAGTPEKKLAGLGYVEYEDGKRAIHGATIDETVVRNGFMMPEMGGMAAAGDCQPAIAGGRIFFTNRGMHRGGAVPTMRYVFTDGSTDVKGITGWRHTKRSANHEYPRLAVSPDGMKLYMTGFRGPHRGGESVVLELDPEGKRPEKIFVGNWGKPGSDDAHLNDPRGIDCDGKGRVYVSDLNNNRIQIFSPEGRHLKSIPCKRPELVRVNPNTGAIYVLHYASERGRTLGRLTKFESFETPREVWYTDFKKTIGKAGRVVPVMPVVMAVDCWSDKPRLWTAGVSGGSGFIGTTGGGPSVQIWEDAGSGVMKIADFDEEARKEAGKNYMGRWSGIGCQWERVVCDPTREQAYFLKGSRLKRLVFDLKTGDLLREVTFPNMVDDIAFDKRGYMHCHFVGTVGAVMRVDPERATRVEVPSYDTEYCPRFALGEVPYNYGIEKDINKYRALGVLPVKDQQGPKHFQDGLGVNMRGDVAVESQIYYVPKMEEQMAKMLNAARINPHGDGPSGKAYTYESSMKDFAERQKRGEKVYSIARRPGVPLHGATIWTYDSTGEVRAESPAVIGRLVAGCVVDEDGALYFICNYPRAVGDKPFLRGKGGTFGIADDRKNRHPHTGTLVKARGKNVKILRAKAEVPLDPRPDRAPDMFFLSSRMVGEENRVWMEGAEWLYGGASPIIDWGCSCPTSRFHLDWYKRTYVPEAYRHSFGVVDTNGNLVMHLGKYGNFDSGNGSKSKVPAGGDNIAVFIPRFMGGTDSYLCFTDWGERLVVLRIAYHAEETAPISD